MKYPMDDGSIVNTDNAVNEWQEASRWDGSNHISVATGSQWEHERLRESGKGRFYIEATSQWQGSLPSARYVSDLEAARWLLANEYEPESMPERLRALVGEVEE